MPDLSSLPTQVLPSNKKKAVGRRQLAEKEYGRKQSVSTINLIIFCVLPTAYCLLLSGPGRHKDLLG